MSKPAASLLTQAQYGRHRGCSKQAVSRAVAAERITTFGPDKLVDAELADAQWQRNTRARASNGAAVASAAASGGVAAPDDETGPGDYGAWRVLREKAEAGLASMRESEMRGELIRLSAVKNALGVMFATARESFLQLPSRLAPQLSGETDPATIQNLLYAEIHNTLMELSGAGDRLGEAAAEGPG